jgi:hypothetical protein
MKSKRLPLTRCSINKGYKNAILLRNSDGKKPLGKHRIKWKDNIKTVLKLVRLSTRFKS